MRNNVITQLPSEIGELKHLTRFDASNNKLNELPRAMHRLTKLTVRSIVEGYVG